MNSRSKVSLSGILVVVSLVTIYFQVYWHYWLVKLSGGYVINTLLPIMILLVISIGGKYLHKTVTNVEKKEGLFVIPLFFYSFLSSISILINEQGFQDIKSMFIYIYSPMLIFVSILLLDRFRRDENIEKICIILSLCAIFVSFYVSFIYLLNPISVTEAAVLETNRGVFSANSGATYGLRGISIVRFTIPGISSATYGPILVPTVFVGYYCAKRAKSSRRFIWVLFVSFLCFCILMTGSRGPLLALLIGFIYLFVWNRSPRTLIWLCLIFVTLILIHEMTKISWLRIGATISDVYNMELSNDPRLASVAESMSLIGQHPIVGIGMTKLIDRQALFYGKEHNNYLSIAASFGLPSLLCYMFFLTYLFSAVHKAIKRSGRKSDRGQFGIILGCGLTSLIIYLNAAPAEFHFIWVWLGITAAWIRNGEGGTAFRRGVSVLKR